MRESGIEPDLQCYNGLVRMISILRAISLLLLLPLWVGTMRASGVEHDLRCYNGLLREPSLT